MPLGAHSARGLLISNTQYGRSVHLSKCEACSTQVAGEAIAGEARRDHGGNDSAFSALGGLTTQSLEVTVQSGRGYRLAAAAGQGLRVAR